MSDQKEEENVHVLLPRKKNLVNKLEVKKITKICNSQKDSFSASNIEGTNDLTCAIRSLKPKKQTHSSASEYFPEKKTFKEINETLENNLTQQHERKLRGSQETTPSPSSHPISDKKGESGEENNFTGKFDFGNEDDILESTIIVIKKLPSNDKSFNYLELSNTYLEKLKTLQRMETQITRTNLSAKLQESNVIDELSDEYYKPFHDCMCKTERKMINKDKVDAANLAESFEVSLDFLKMITWKQRLPKITLVKNINDDEEMEEKRELTIETITELLEKYEDMNNRSKLLRIKQKKPQNNKIPRGALSKQIIDPYKIRKVTDHNLVNTSPSKKTINFKSQTSIYQKLDSLHLLNYDSSSDEEENSMKTAKDIRLHRQNKTFQKYRHPTIILKCGTFDIVAYPFQNPKIVQTPVSR